MQVETLGSECGRPTCSVAWSQRGTYLAAGGDSGAVQIYDAATVGPPLSCPMMFNTTLTAGLWTSTSLLASRF